MKPMTIPEAIEAVHAATGLKIGKREFRRRVRALGCCFKHGHVMTMSPDHVATFIESLQCPSVSIQIEKPASGKSGERKSSPVKAKASALERARARLIAATLNAS